MLDPRASTHSISDQAELLISSPPILRSLIQSEVMAKVLVVGEGKRWTPVRQPQYVA
jgi:hypothetical protein